MGLVGFRVRGRWAEGVKLGDSVRYGVQEVRFRWFSMPGYTPVA